jgi:hypothetical protein
VVDEASRGELTTGRHPHLVVGAVAGFSRWFADTASNAGGTPRTDGTRQLSPLSFVVIGALCAAEERLADTARAGAATARAVGGTVVNVSAPLVPAPIKRVVADSARQLERQGRAAVGTGSAEVARVAEALAGGAAGHSGVVHVIDEVVERLIDTLLPAILDRLAAEPEQIRVIIQGQSRGMIEEVANTARSRAADGDVAVDRAVSRLLRRPRAKRQTPSVEVLGALPPGPPLPAPP